MKYLLLRLLLFVRLHFRLIRPIQSAIDLFVIKLSGGWMYSKEIRDIYRLKHNILIGYGSYGGCFSLRNIPPGVEFGNYCSIAPNIRIFRANHPSSNFTTHPLLYNPVAGVVKRDLLDRPKIFIGHDVWIGEWVILTPSVTKIGNGAIIGAGSVVTKDVLPYSIMAGNPAKLIRMRFSEEVIKRIEETEWWNDDKDGVAKSIADLNLIVCDKN